MKKMIEKKRGQFPLRSPNLETALSVEVSGAIKKGSWSLIVSKITIDIMVNTRIRPESIMVFLMLSGLRNPRSFHVMLLALIRQVATINVVDDQNRPFTINPTFEKYISLTKNITDM